MPDTGTGEHANGKDQRPFRVDFTANGLLFESLFFETRAEAEAYAASFTTSQMRVRGHKRSKQETPDEDE